MDMAYPSIGISGRHPASPIHQVRPHRIQITAGPVVAGRDDQAAVRDDVPMHRAQELNRRAEAGQGVGHQDAPELAEVSRKAARVLRPKLHPLTGLGMGGGGVVSGGCEGRR